MAHTGRQGDFDQLRAFLTEHAGQRVRVEITVDKAMDGMRVISATRILRPLTHADYEHLHGRVFPGEDNARHVDWATEHNADFWLLDARGDRVADVHIWEHALRDVEIGRSDEISTYLGRELVVTRLYADFTRLYADFTRLYADFDSEIMRWDHDTWDAEGVPAVLPSRLINARVTRWIETSVEQAVEELTDANTRQAEERAELVDQLGEGGER